MANGADKPLVFVSYSKADSVWKDHYLLVHLAGLENAGLITAWSDDDLDPGGEWLVPLVEAMTEAKVAVCLLSPNYLKTKFIIDEELPLLIQRAEREGLKLLFLLVEPCDWEAHYWLDKRQLFLRKGKCVQIDYAGKEHLPFTMLAKHIREFLGETAPRREHLPMSPRIAEALERLKGDTAASLAGVSKENIDEAEEATSVDQPRTENPPLPSDAIDLTRLPTSGFDVVGRDDELRMLDEAFDGDELNVVSLRAWGGVGKSTLVNKWCEYLAADNYRGARRVFAWSFYSQGTNERVTSADAFIDAALRFFGDENPEAGSAWAKGERLAELVGRGKALLLLDGLEPLQNEHQGIKDPALARLIECLAERNAGLCVITTRMPVKELSDFAETTAETDLEYLSKEAGRALLRIKGIRAADELLEKVSEAFGNHALALNLLASYLKRYAGNDVSLALEIPDLPDISVDAGKHPRRVMAAFAKRFGEGPELDLLHVMGLFDRPADAGCIASLRREPAIPGLTDHLVQDGSDLLDQWWRQATGKQEAPSSDAIWEKLLTHLRDLGLLAEASHHALDELDAHPLVREHFGARLRAEREDAWKAGHDRLYEHLKGQAEHRPDTLAEMAPLFQAVHHGCQAGRRQEAYKEIYRARIRRDNEFHLVKKLGALGADLGLIASFFDLSFEQPATDLTGDERAELLAIAAFDLRALGRLSEAVAPMRSGLDMRVEQEKWGDAARIASNLSELQLALGDVEAAVAAGKESVDYADRSGTVLNRIGRLVFLAKAQHEAGEFKDAKAQFEKAERMLEDSSTGWNTLVGTWGYEYCDLLLTHGDCAKEVSRRANYSLDRGNRTLLDTALDYLSLGRAARAMEDRDEAGTQLDQAVDGLRKAGTMQELPRGLLARAAFFREVKAYVLSQRDLAEVMRLATRCGMRLHECDAHLEYARLALAEGKPDDARPHLKSAEALVSACGYHRRDPEIAELKEKLGR